MANGDEQASERRAIQRCVDLAREISGLRFAVRVGNLPEGRTAAVAAHARLADAERTVLVAVDPTARTVDIVTGRVAALAIDDRACEFAVLSMVSSFANDDLIGGLRGGITLLAEHARMPLALHRDQP